MKKYFQHLIFILATSASLGASAQALQQVNSNGMLTGATGVKVGTSYYDVVFKTGTCNMLEPGCGGADFVMRYNAIAAATALSEQVFTGAFDSTPARTLGCNPATTFCQIMTPHMINTKNATKFNYALFYNAGTEADDFTNSGQSSFGKVDNTTTFSTFSPVFAIWSPSSPNPGPVPPLSAIPEPETYAMMAMGLALIVSVTRRRKLQTNTDK